MGSLASRIGPRIPLMTGPLVVAAGMLVAWLMQPGTSYWTGTFPTVLVMAIGMTIAVAPLTSSVLGSVEEQHVAMASGFNSAVARTGGLIATAMLGAVLGSKGAELFAGFHMAMSISAIVAAAAAAVALTMLGGVKMKKA
jgi:MFS family permease